jgi:hypothetical protein
MIVLSILVILVMDICASLWHTKSCLFAAMTRKGLDVEEVARAGGEFDTSHVLRQKAVEIVFLVTYSGR